MQVGPDQPGATQILGDMTPVIPPQKRHRASKSLIRDLQRVCGDFTILLLIADDPSLY